VFRTTHLVKNNVWSTQFPTPELRVIVEHMKFLTSVPLEVAKPLSNSDPDVRSVSRLPGFVRLEGVSGHAGRYTLTFEVEAGSRRDAMDASDELLVEYKNALSAYGPRLLAELATESR
jgi:hypothetical protein